MQPLNPDAHTDLACEVAAKFSLSPSGLTFLAHPSFDEWAQIGQHLFNAEQSIQWAIGDWLIFGEDNLARVEKGRYQQLLEILGKRYSYSTLTHYAYTSRAFPICDRTQNLDWTHYYIIARAGEQHRDRWLNIAKREAEKGNRIPKRLLRRSIECGQLLKPSDLLVPPEEKAIDNHCSWIVGLRNWWRKFKDDKHFWKHAQPHEIDALIQDFQFVEEVYQRLLEAKNRLSKH